MYNERPGEKAKGEEPKYEQDITRLLNQIDQLNETEHLSTKTTEPAIEESSPKPEVQLNKQVKEVQNKKSWAIAGFILVAALIMTKLLFDSAGITGLASIAKPTYTHEMNETFYEDSVYELLLSPNQTLESLKISGLIEGHGLVRIYLEQDGSNDSLILFDSEEQRRDLIPVSDTSSVPNSITGFAILDDVNTDLEIEPLGEEEPMGEGEQESDEIVEEEYIEENITEDEFVEVETAEENATEEYVVEVETNETIPVTEENEIDLINTTNIITDTTSNITTDTTSNTTSEIGTNTTIIPVNDSVNETTETTANLTTNNLTSANITEPNSTTLLNLTKPNETIITEPTEPINITLLSPLQGSTISNWVTFSYNIENTSNVDNCTLYTQYKYLEDDFSPRISETELFDGLNIFEIEDLAPGEYLWNIRCVANASSDSPTISTSTTRTFRTISYDANNTQEFNELCLETCEIETELFNTSKNNLSDSISDLDSSMEWGEKSYRLRIEVGNAAVKIGKLTYTIKEDAYVIDNATNISETVAYNISENIDEMRTLQSEVEVGKPVHWKHRILIESGSNTTLNNVTLNITKNAQDINVYRYRPGGKSKLYKHQLITGNMVKLPPGQIAKALRTKVLEEQELAEELFQQLTIEDSDIENGTEYEIEYTTPGPNQTEIILGPDKKRITIGSDIHYLNVSAQTNITARDASMVRLYHLINGSRVDVTENPEYSVRILDSDGDGAPDKLDWTVPHLSNQTFEIGIVVLNVQSYPTVNDYWVVDFNTTGNANLTIRAINFTEWSNETEEYDLKFISITCGNETSQYEWINNKVFIEDYECNLTSHEKSKVLTFGKHHLEFTFGNSTAYAHNDAVSATYTMSDYSTAGHYACETGNLGAGNTPTNYDSCQNSALSGDYSAIDTSDNTRWTTGIADADTEYDLQIYHFNITQNPTTIDQLNVTWEGQSSETRGGYDLSAYLWSDSGQSWESINSDSDGSTSDVSWATSKTSSITNYVDQETDGNWVYFYARFEHWVDGCPYIYACTEESGCDYVHDSFSMSFMESLEDTSYQTYKGRMDYINITEPFELETSYINDFKVYGIRSDLRYLPEEKTGKLHSVTDWQKPDEVLEEDRKYLFIDKDESRTTDAKRPVKVIVNSRHNLLSVLTGKYIFGNLGANWYDFYEWLSALPIINWMWRETIDDINMRVYVNDRYVDTIRGKSDTITYTGEDFLVYTEIESDTAIVELKHPDTWYTINHVTVDFTDDVPVDVEEINTDFEPFNISTDEHRIINMIFEEGQINDYDNYLFEIKGWYYPEWALSENATFGQSMKHLFTKVVPPIVGNGENYVTKNIDEIYDLKRNSILTDYVEVKLRYQESVAWSSATHAMGLTNTTANITTTSITIDAIGGQDNIDVDCASGNCSVITHNVTDGIDLSDGQSVTVEFECGASPYTDVYWAVYNLTSDNDTSVAQINASCIVAIEYDKFDSATFTGASNAPWERGSATQFSGCYEGSNCWATDLDANYAASGPYQDNLTQSTGTNLSNYQDVQLYFYHYRHFEDSGTAWDGGVVDLNNGSGWTRITPEGGYTDTITGNGALNGESAYANYGSGWELAQFNLSSYSNQSDVKIRFAFGADDATGDWGWAVDQVYYIGDYVSIDPAISWSSASLNMGSGTTGYGNLTSSLNLNAFLDNNQINVSCASGSCTTITQDWTNGTSITSGGSTPVNFTCNDSTTGSYSAVFSVVSSEDDTVDQVSVSCSMEAVAINWSTTSLDMGSVSRNTSKVETDTITAGGNNTNIVVTNIAGNGTGVINMTTTSIPDLNHSNTSSISFNCSVNDTVDLGLYYMTYEVNSTEAPSGDIINVTCTAIDYDYPPTVTLLSPADNSLDTDGNVTLTCNVQDTEGIANITLYTNTTGSWLPNQSIPISTGSNDGLSLSTTSTEFTVSKGDGSTSGDFKLVFDAAYGGCINEWYDMDASTTENKLDSTDTTAGLLFLYARIGANSYRSCDDDISGKTFEVLESNPVRVRIRAVGALEAGTSELAGTTIETYYTVYPNGRIFTETTRNTTTSETIDDTYGQEFGIGYHESRNFDAFDDAGTSFPGAGSSDYICIYSNNAGAGDYADAILTPYEDWSGADATNEYTAGTPSDKVWFQRNDDWTANVNETQDYLIMIEPNTMDSYNDADITTRVADYRNPATVGGGKLSFSIGSSYAGEDGDTAGDGFNEREGSYAMNASGNIVEFDMTGSTYNRFQPTFKIFGYNVSDEPAVTLDGVALTKGTGYNSYINESTDVLLVQYLGVITGTSTFHIGSIGTDFNASFTLTDLTEKNYTWNCRAYDTVGQYDEGDSIRSFHVLLYGITWNQSTLDLGMTSLNNTLDENIELTSTGANSNVTIYCVEGSCSAITTNFTNESSMTDGQTIDINFSCHHENVSGELYALYNITTENIDTYSQINVSCINAIFYDDFDTSSYFSADGTNTAPWERGTPSSGQFGNACYSGSNCWATDLNANYVASGPYDDMLTMDTGLNLADYTSIELKFYHYKHFEDSGDLWDAGVIDVNDNGGGWTRVTPSGGYDGSVDSGAGSSLASQQAFGYYGSGWEQETFDLSSYDRSSSLQMRFYFATDQATNDWGWAVDKVYFLGTYSPLGNRIEWNTTSEDMGITELPNNDTTAVSIDAIGAQSSINVTCYSGDCSMVQHNHTDDVSLSAGQSEVVQFTCNNTLDAKAYSASFQVTSAEDSTPHNITVSCMFALFYDNFDTDEHWYITGDDEAPWERGSATQFGGCYDGSNCWATDLDANYASPIFTSYDDSLNSNVSVNLSLYENVELKFRQYRHFQSSSTIYDAGIVYANTGSGWTKITPEGGYTGSITTGSGSPFEGETAYGLYSSGWELETFDLANYNHVDEMNIRFTFAADWYTADWGWALDDVYILGTYSPVNAQVRWNESSFDIGVAQIGNDATGLVQILPNDNHTSINISCHSGNCEYFTTNFTNNTDLDDQENMTVQFNCSDSQESGKFWAVYNVSSAEDNTPHQINVSCILAIYYDEFDSATFSADASNTAPWERGSASQFGGCYDGSNCWATDLDANYVSSGPYDDYLTQDSGVNLTNYANVSLELYHYRYFESSTTLYDAGVVDLNDGTGWTRMTPEEGYTGSVYGSAGSSLANQQAYGEHGSGWEIATFNLSAYDHEDNISTRFLFATDQNTADWGWAIDTFYMVGTYSVPPEIVEWNQSTLDLGITELNNTLTSYANVIATTGTNNNVRLSCASGDCDKIHTNLTNGTTLTQGQNFDIEFKCNETIYSGEYSAIYQVWSDQDTSVNNLTVSCIMALFYDTFESSGGFDNDSTNSAPWQRGSATQFGGCYQGTQCWATGLGVNYAGSGPYDDYLTQVDAMDLTHYEDIRLKFYHYRHFEDNTSIYDAGVVDADGGGGWSRITPEGLYTGTVSSGTGSNIANQDAYGLYDTGWAQAEFKLTGYDHRSSVKTRFRFSSDNTGGDWGWAIDDLYYIGDYKYFPNTIPTQGAPILNTSVGMNTTVEDLICNNQSTYDADGDELKNIYNWYINDTQIMVLHLPFEGGSNSTYTKDYSNLSNDGVPTGAAWNARTGYDDFSAYEYIINENDLLTVADDPSLELSNAGYTLSAWIFPNTFGEDSNGIILEKTDNSSGYAFAVIDAGSTIAGLRLYHNDTSTYVSSTNNALTEDVWHHVAVTFENGIVTFYVNGTNVTGVSSLGNMDPDTASDLIIGNFDDGSKDFYGYIDDVKIFNRSLSQGQVQELAAGNTHKISYEETYDEDVWVCEVTTNDRWDDSTTNQSNDLTVVYDPPPDSVSGLHERFKGKTWIDIAWTDPSDSDFADSLVYLDGNLQGSTTHSRFTLTGLSTGSTHTVTVHSRDTRGVVNDTDVNLTFTTITPSYSTVYVQRREAFLLPNETVINTTIDVVDLEKTFLLCKSKNDVNAQDGPANFTATCRLNGNDTVTIERYGNNSNITVSYQVVEADNIVVQNGTTTVASGSTTGNGDFASSIDTSKTIVVFSQRLDTVTTGQMERLYHTSSFYNTTRIEFERGQSGSEATIDWFAIEFQDDTTVQSKQISSWNIDVEGSDSQDDTIDTSVDPANSWLVYNYRVSQDGLSRTSIAGNISNSSNVHFWKETSSNTTPDPEVNLRWFVVEFESGADSSVQQGVYFTSASSDYSEDISISSVDMTGTFSYFGHATCEGSGSAYPRPFWINYINDTDNLHIERGYYGQDSDLAWQIVSWPTSYNNPPTHDNPVLTSTYSTNYTTENLTCNNVGTADDDGDSIKSIVTWIVNSTYVQIVDLPFEGGSNSTYTKDYSGRYNDATPTDNNAGNGDGNTPPVWNQTGGSDGFGAYKFDGVDDYINMSELFDANSSSWSVSLWFDLEQLPSSLGTTQYLLSQKGGSGTARDWIYVESVGDELQSYLGGATRSSGVNISSPVIWHHVVLTWDANTRDLRWYHQGSTWSYTAVDVESADGDFILGADNTLSTFFNGSIDGLIIFNRTISAEQIYKIYENKMNVLISDGTNADDTWLCYVTPNDGTEDGTSKGSNTLTVREATNPTVLFVKPDEGSPYYVNDSVYLSANVSDASGLSSVKAEVEFPNTTKQNFTMSARNNSTITIDGTTSDWDSGDLIGSDDNEASLTDAFDIQSAYVTNNDEWLFLRMDLYGSGTKGFNFSLYNYSILIDQDLSKTTGYSNNSAWDAGYDYMVNNDSLYSYAGSGEDWNWALNSSATYSFNSDYNVSEWRVNRSLINASSEYKILRLLFRTSNTTHQDNAPDNYISSYYEFWLSEGHYGYTLNSTEDTGRYNVTIFATDNNDNINSTETTWFNVSFAADSTPPITTLISPVDAGYNDTSDPVTITFTCNATDNQNLANISLYITNATNESFAYANSSSLSGSSDSASFNHSLENGDYTWNCLSFDVSGYSDWDTNRTLSINYSIGNTAPTHTKPILNSTDGSDEIDQDLTCYNQSTDDIDDDVVKNIISWKKDGSGITVLNLPFEGGSNTTWTRDYSPYLNNGSVSNAVWNSNTGYDGKGAYTFDGTSTYITVPDQDEISLNKAFTITAWVNDSGDGDYQVITAKNTEYLFRKDNSAEGSYISCFAYLSAAWEPRVSTTAPISTNEWHHLTCTWDNSTGNLSIYVDGQLNATTTGRTGSVGATTSALEIGRWNSGNYWNGTLDEIQIFNESLSATQVQLIYENRTDKISYLETALDEEWMCSVTPNDGADDGETLESLALTIKNSPPTQTAPVLNSTSGNNNTLENLTCYNQSFADVNSDNVTAIFNWYKDDSALMMINMPFEGTDGNESSWTKDYSSNNNHGSVTSATWNSTGGYNGQGAYEFDGSNDKITTGTTNRPTNTFSFGGWIKALSTHEVDAESNTTTTGTSGQKYAFGAAHGGSNAGAGLSVGTNGISVYEHGDSYMPPLAVYSSSIGSDWNHIMIVYENRQPKIYLNGALVRTGVFSARSTVYAPYEIGAGSYGYFNGSMDEVKVYDSALSAAQVLALYNNRSDVIVTDELSIDDVWKCEVYPHDGTEWGNNLSSNTVTIVNNAPTHTTPIINTTDGTNTSAENITCYNQSTYDADGDAVKSIFNWYRNDTSITVLNMPFEATGGNESTWARDYSGYSNNGIIDSATWSASGGHDGSGAYVFAGEQIDLGLPAELNFVNQDNFTISTWVKVAGSTGTHRPIVCKGDTQYCLKPNPVDTFEFCIYDGGYRCVNSDATVTLNAWYHVVARVNGSEVAMWINGTKQSTPGTRVGNINSDGYNVTIGRDDEYTSRIFNGTIDEVQIFNYALTEEQINQSFLGNYDVMLSTETTDKDAWICEVTPNDGNNDGTSLNSSVMDLTDTVNPLWSNNETNSSTATKYGNSVYFNVTLTDNKLGGYQIFSFYNGTHWANDSATSWSTPAELTESRTINAMRDSTIRWYWWFNDSFGNSNQTDIWNFTVDDTAPTQGTPVLNSTTGSNASSENLTCYNTSFSDLEGDDLSAIFTTYRNGSTNKLFHLPFDNNQTDIFGDNPISNSGTNYSTGKDLSAIYVSDGDDLNYSATGNINTTYGTVELWVNAQSDIWENSEENYLFYYRVDASNQIYIFTTSTNSTRFVYQGAADSDLYTTDVTDSWSSSEWHHVAMTWNLSVPEYRVYLDGALQGTPQTSISDFDQTGGAIWVGDYLDSESDALIDNLIIYDRPLSANEISAHYAEAYDTIISERTVVGDEWYCEVIPSDDEYYGTSAQSNTVTVVESDTSAPSITDITIDPALNISYFGAYNVSANVTDFTEVDYVYLNLSAINGDNVTCWEFYANGTCAHSEPLIYEMPNISDDIYMKQGIWPDNIYPQIELASDDLYWYNEPEQMELSGASYHMIHFVNNFTFVANTSFWIEFDAQTTGSSSGAVNIYLVGRGEDETFFQSNWRNDPNTDIVGSITEDTPKDHTHTANSRHYLIRLLSNDDGTIGSKDLNVTDDFWIVVYKHDTKTSKAFELNYLNSSLCDDGDRWYTGSRSDWSITPQAGCPNVHTHIARDNLQYRDGVNITVCANDTLSYSTCESSQEYFATLPPLPPTPTGFYTPENGTFSEYLNITWAECIDPNGDSVTYNLSLRNTDGSFNLTIENGISDLWKNWNTRGATDGTYDLLMYCCDDGGLCSNFSQSEDYNNFTIDNNDIPTHDNPILNSSLGTNYTDEDLTCYNQSTSDAESNVVKNVINWYLNDTSIHVLNMPFDGSDNSTTKDYSPYENNGTVSTAIYNATGGYDGKGAYEFDGGSGNEFGAGSNSYIGVGQKAEHRLGVHMSLEAWIKPAVQDQYDGIVHKMFDSGSTESGYGLYLDGTSGVYFGLVPEGSSAIFLSSGASTITLGDWNHVVGTYDGETMRVYVNGVEENTQSVSATSIDYNPLPDLDIGRYYDDDDELYEFNGSIDEVRIYNITLTAQQVASLHNNRTDIIEYQQTTRGEQWQCEITPNDGYIYGTAKKSNNLTIRNFVTTHSTPVLNSSDGKNSTLENLTCYNQSFYDKDVDNLRAIYNWYFNGTSLTVLNMPFEGGSNDTWTKDYTVYENDGVVNGAEWNATSVDSSDGGYIFEGGTGNEFGASQGDYINLSQHNEHAVGANFTIEAWIYPREQDAYDGIVHKLFDTGATESGYGLYLDGTSGAYFGLVPTGSSAIYLSSGVGTITLNDWNHVVGTYDGETMRIYIDGDEAANQTVSATSIDYSPAVDLLIGRYSDDDEVYAFNGSIGEVKIFNRSLTANQVKILYKQDNIIDSSETVLGDEWKCEITPNDGIEDGNNLSSSILTIVDPPIYPPTLTLPINGSTITNRTPTFAWDNSEGGLGNNITYHIIVDTSTAFDNPVINTTGVNESASGNTSYNATVELDIDTIYYWKVRATDSYKYSDYSGIGNFTLSSYLALSIIDNLVDFGDMDIGTSNDTTNLHPAPFRVENAGNIFANVSVTATRMFNSGDFPSDNYQFKVRENESNAFNVSISTTSWTNISNESSAYDTLDLDWHDYKDNFIADILLDVPSSEPTGNRSSTVTFEAS